MIWSGKEPPTEPKKGDIWFNEINGKTYEVDINGGFWFCDDDIIPFS